MKNKLHNSILICTVLILSFVSCKIENNSKPTERFKKTNKIDEVLIDTITTITSIDKKWNRTRQYRTKNIKIIIIRCIQMQRSKEKVLTVRMQSNIVLAYL